MNEIHTLDDWNARLNAGADSPIFIFKHSTACPISAAAFQRVEKYRAEHEAAPEFLLVKVIESRPVSNAIAETLGVQHKSPQLILIKDGQAVWSSSHHGIQADAINDALQRFSEA